MQVLQLTLLGFGSPMAPQQDYDNHQDSSLSILSFSTLRALGKDLLMHIGKIKS